MDWLDLLAVQVTLNSLLQYHSSKASILRSAFFIAQLSQPYMTTGKTIALTRRTLVGKVMNALISHASKVMLKILQAKLQQYMNCELPDVQAGFRKKGRGTRDQIANIHWITEKTREFQKNIYFCFIDYAKTFDYGDHNKLWKILREMGTSDYLICLLRNLYAGQETTVRTGHGKTDWFHLGKGVRQGCILSPGLFNLYAEYIMRNAGLEETQAGIKIAGRNTITSDMQMTPPLWQKMKRN